MIRALVVAALASLLLTGATCSHSTKPVPAQCNAVCFTPCVVDGDTGVQWDADPANPSAWDDLGGRVVPELADKLRVCEVRRQACDQCLRRLDKVRVIEL